MNYIQYMKEPFQPIGFTAGVPTDKQAFTGVQKIRLAGITSDKTPTKEELIQQREEQVRSQAKKENNIITETDRQNAEINDNIENATTPRWQKGLKLARNAANFGLGAGAFVGTTMAYPYFAAAGPGGLAAVGGLQGTALGMMGNALEDQYGFNAGLTSGNAIKDATLGAVGESVLGPLIGKGMNWVGNKIAPIYKPVVHKVSDLVQKGVSNVKNLPTTIQRRTVTSVPAFFGKIGLSDISNWIRGYGKQLSFKDFNQIRSTLENTIPDGSHQDVLNRLNFIYRAYGIPTISDDVAKLNDEEFLNYITKELEKQNTFTRGVRLTAEDTKLPIDEQLKKYEQYALEYAPETGHGRADAITNKYGNLDYIHGEGNSGTIYLSNSYDQADAYALASVRNKKAGDVDGKIAVVRFPLTPYKGDIYQYIYDNLPLTETESSFVENAQSVLLSQHKPRHFRSWYLYSEPTSQLVTTPEFVESFNYGDLRAHQLWKTRIKYNSDKGPGFSFRKGGDSLIDPGIAIRHTILRGKPGTASPLELVELRDPSKFNIFRTRYHTGRIAKDLSDFKSGGKLNYLNYFN